MNSNTLARTIATLLQQFSNLHGVVTVARDDHILFSQGFSSSFVPSPTCETQYLIASLTKNFTSAALLKIFSVCFANDIDRALHQPISFFLDKDHEVFERLSFDLSKNLTIHQLLSHTAKINSDSKNQHEPPTYKYSNINYIILGHIIQSATKQSLEDFYKESLFDCSGMRNTKLVTSNTQSSEIANLCPGFDHQGVAHPNFSELFTAGGIISTAADLVRWQNALYKGNILAPDRVRLMTYPVIAKKGDQFFDGTTELFTGYGVDIVNTYKSRIFQICGGTANYQAKMSYCPRTHISIINLSNKREIQPQIFTFANALRALTS